MLRTKLFLLFIARFFLVQAQEDLLELLEAETADEKNYATATFKSTRIINGHSIETRSNGTLEFIIAHRFGTLNSGYNDFWGLDFSRIRLGLEYGVTDDLTVGVGRSSFEKVLDAFGKYRVLRQSNTFPMTVTVFGSFARTLDQNAPESGLERNAYTGQLLIARKFNSSFSFQVSPTIMQRNRVATTEDDNLLLAIGIGGRYKLSNRVAVVSEYYHQLSDYSDRFYNTIAFGVDIETGGHVFQLHFTNAVQMNEKALLEKHQKIFGMVESIMASILLGYLT